MESLTNDTEILTFVQLGFKTGLHFQGSVQGIWPIGPNVLPAFDMLAPFPLSKPEIAAGVISYDYTLKKQGLKSNVTCSYAPTYPFNITSLSPTGVPVLAVSYNVSCTDHGKTDALNMSFIPSSWSNNTLVYWACQDNIPMASYTIYLTGFYDYAKTIGNITCVINPIESAIYSVTYQSTENVFSATEENASSPITFSALINSALVGLVDFISGSQNYQNNVFVETIINLGINAFDLLVDPNLPPQQYLIIYEKMIQGIIEHGVCPVNYFIPFLFLIACRLTDDLLSDDLFDGSLSPSLLPSHSDWTIEIWGVRLVHDECQHWLFDSNNDHQPGRLGRSLSSYDHRERWWLCVSSFPT